LRRELAKRRNWRVPKLSRAPEAIAYTITELRRLKHASQKRIHAQRIVLTSAQQDCRISHPQPLTLAATANPLIDSR
jgi:hypothetical protein